MLGGRGWNGQRSAENKKRGGSYKVSIIESQINVKIAFFYKIILCVYKKKLKKLIAYCSYCPI
jgi:hypothetical protein